MVSVEVFFSYNGRPLGGLDIKTDDDQGPQSSVWLEPERTLTPFVEMSSSGMVVLGAHCFRVGPVLHPRCFVGR